MSGNVIEAFINVFRLLKKLGSFSLRGVFPQLCEFSGPLHRVSQTLPGGMSFTSGSQLAFLIQSFPSEPQNTDTRDDSLNSSRVGHTKTVLEA